MITVDSYSVNLHTMVFVPHFEGDYFVKVKERNRTEPIYVKKTGLKLIDLACREQLSNFDARRDAARDWLDFPTKQPIAIDILHKIYAFPTESPFNPTCHWLFLSHIKKIVPLHRSSKNGKKRTKIIFKDNQEIIIEQSYYSIRNQYDRALYCKELFEDMMSVGDVQYKIIAEPQFPYLRK